MAHIIRIVRALPTVSPLQALVAVEYISHKFGPFTQDQLPPSLLAKFVDGSTICRQSLSAHVEPRTNDILEAMPPTDLSISWTSWIIRRPDLLCFALYIDGKW